MTYTQSPPLFLLRSVSYFNAKYLLGGDSATFLFFYFPSMYPWFIFRWLFHSVFVCAATSLAKESRTQLSQEQSGSVSQAHFPLTAVTKNSSETSAASKPDQVPAAVPNPLVPESPTVKRGVYPFKHGEDNSMILKCVKVYNMIIEASLNCWLLYVQ